MLGLLEIDGMTGALRGAWVATDDGPPDFAATTPANREHARDLIRDARRAVAGGRTWQEFLEHLRERQNVLTIARVEVSTELTAEGLLRQAQALWSLWNDDSATEHRPERA